MNGVKTGIVTLSLLMVMLGTACTRKNNLTSDNISHTTPLTVRDTTFTMGYSYRTTGKVMGTETSILAGSQDGVEATALMQFTTLPDTLIATGQPTLKLVAVKSNPAVKTPVELAFYKVTRNWAADSTALVTPADMTPLDIPHLMVNTIAVNHDSTFTVNIPPAVIDSWKTTGVTGWNIAIKAVNAGWVEFGSKEHGTPAELSFTYHVGADTTSHSFKVNALKDSYILTGTQPEIVNNNWTLRNAFAQRIYAKLMVPQTLFRDKDGNALSTADVKRVTVNRAELVFYVKSAPYYQATAAKFYPYNVLNDSLSTPRVLVDADLQSLAHTLTTEVTLDRDSLRVDVTPIIQNYLAHGVYNAEGINNLNKGIVIKSMQEWANFGKVELWHYLDAPAGKKPYLNIQYTPPYLH